jgi:hypothetical protein
MKHIKTRIKTWWKAVVAYFQKHSFIKKALFVILAVALLGGILGVATPRIVTQSLQAPRLIKQPNAFNNQDIEFESSDNLLVEKDGKFFWPAPNYKNIAKFGKLDGKQTFRLYNFADFGFTKVKSQKFTEVVVESNYTTPTFRDLDVKKATPTKEDAFSFILSKPDLVVKKDGKPVFDPSKTENQCTKEQLQTTDYKITCQFSFGDQKETKLNYTLADKYGNETKILDNFLVKNVDLPKLECPPLPEFTTTSPAKITCTSNKKGILTDDQGQTYNLEKDKPLDFTVPIKEGLNKLVFSFKDDDGFDLNKEFATTMDTNAPEIKFTFLDTKKKFQEGSFTLKFIPNESVSADVRVRPYNETFENDPRMKSPLFAKTWGYYGGNTVSGKTIAADEETAIVTKNDLGGCQLYDSQIDGKKLLSTPQGLCDLYNVFFVKTDITVKDRAGNASSYQCTSYTWDPNKNPSGELPTECVKVG